MSSSSRSTAQSVAIALLVIAVAGCAATPVELDLDERARIDTGAVDKRTLLSDAVIAKLLDASVPGCSAAVGVEGEVLWAGAGGLADLGNAVPMTTATRFDIASVTKQFTATAILLLQREGRLSLSDPVSSYVDGLPSWGRTVTLDQLMHHTSRIPDFWVALDDEGIGFSDPASMAQTLDAIRRERRLDAGTGYEYSNSNYTLLAAVIERVSGESYPQFLADRIFTPLGLAMTVAPTLHADDVALSYDDDGSLQESGWAAYGHTGIITTPSELVRWGDQYRAGDLIQDDFAVGAVDEGTGESYAAGMDIEPDGDLNHDGRWGGYITTFTVSADRTTTIAVSCNGHLAPRFPIADALWDIWHPAEKIPTPTETPGGTG